MMVHSWQRLAAGAWAGIALLAASHAAAAAPTAPDALKLQPMQPRVAHDKPDAKEAAECTIKAEKVGELTGWVVRNPAGQVLRMFLDTNADNIVDSWSYYQDGLEVYRDIDSNFNGKADQHRWMNTAGSRWGLDPTEDGQIDSWKMLSAEELTAELVAALADKNAAAFELLLLTPDELSALGLGAEKARELSEKLRAAPAEFKKLAAEQKDVTAATRWIHFGGSQPGVYPAGTDGGTRDVVCYENVVTMYDTAGTHGQIHVGTLVRAGDVWRLIGAPVFPVEGQDDVAAGFFFKAPLPSRSDTGGAGGAPSSEMQKLLADLEALDKEANPDASYHASRADLLEKLASSAGEADRAQWLRQLADSVSAAVQSGEFPAGVDRLQNLYEKLSAQPESMDLAAYVKFRTLVADYGLKLQGKGVDFVKVQAEWLESLERFVGEYPTSPDTAEAMLQLAIAKEFAGQDDEAKDWYGQIVTKFAESTAARKAAGARTRLDSVGKPMRLAGPSPAGTKVDLKDLKGKVVLVHYWATWCEPCVADMTTLKELQSKYGKSGFTLLGVSLDNDKQDLTNYLRQNRVNWPQIFEPGNLEGRPAQEMGILTLPTMLLIDKDGRVLNRNIHVSEVEPELKKILR